MDYEIVKCELCGSTMQGRVDRKYCSAKCRQKAYRAKRGHRGVQSLAAEPFPLSEDSTPYRYSDGFWQAVSTVPDLVAGLAVYDADADLAEFGMEEEDGRPKVSIYPARRKAKELCQRDMDAAGIKVRAFLDEYDEVVSNLARMRATVQIIAEYHGYV